MLTSFAWFSLEAFSVYSFCFPEGALSGWFFSISSLCLFFTWAVSYQECASSLTERETSDNSFVFPQRYLRVSCTGHGG